MLKKVLLLCIVMMALLAPAHAQIVQPVPYRGVPDCFFPFKATAAGLAQYFDNRPPYQSFFIGGCNSWVLEYSASGLSALNMTVVEAVDASTNTTDQPGAWVPFTNAISYSALVGTIPVTNTTGNLVMFSGYAPWVGIQVNSVTGTGVITGVLYGFHTDPQLNRTSAISSEQSYLNDSNNGTLTQALQLSDVRDRVVSAVATQTQRTYDLVNLHDTLAISAVCSAGTAALTVASSSDNSTFITLDSITAAGTNVKQYTATTVGATVALSPLSFRYLQVTVASCGGGNTSTLTLGAK